VRRELVIVIERRRQTVAALAAQVEALEAEMVETGADQ